MKTPNQLKQQARDDCLAHVKQTLPGEFAIEILDSNLEWDPDDLRHLFEQVMVVWHKFGQMEILLDADNRPVGFVDETKWQDCRWSSMSEDDVIALAEKTGYVEPGASVLSMQEGRRGCVEAILGETGEDATEKRFRVEINPRIKAVISVVPVVEEES